jgi:hypothetical protein
MTLRFSKGATYFILYDYWLKINIQVRLDRRILPSGPGSDRKNKGVGLGMTWRLKVQRAAFAFMVLGLLALASGANWVDALSSLDW